MVIGIAGGSHIRLNIDPTGLSYGAHYAEVRGYDVEKPELGPLIRYVPVVRWAGRLWLMRLY